MAIDVSWVEVTVPPAAGTLDGGGTITNPPPPITGTVRATGVASKKAVGIPAALFLSKTQLIAALSVQRASSTGTPAVRSIVPAGQKVVTIQARSVPRKLTWYTFFFGRIGRPSVTSRRTR